LAISGKIFPFLFVNLVLSAVALGQISDETFLLRWLRKKPVIKSIAIEGNKFYSDSRIKRVMFSREDNIIRTIKADRNRRVQKETMLRDTSEVKYLYLTSGFLAVKLREIYEPILPDSNARIVLTVDEGRQFFYGSTSLLVNPAIDGDGEFDLKSKGELAGIIGRVKISRPVDPFGLRQIVYDCKSYLANNGYPYARVAFSIDTVLENDRAKISFTIETDSLVHFGDVRINGAEHFDTSQVRREITFKSGDLYRRQDILESQKRLLGAGNYLTLQMYSPAQDTADKSKRLNPDFILNLKEKKPHYLSVKTGAGQDPYKDLIWDFSAAWGKRNIFRSRQVEFSAKSSFVIFTEWRVINHSYKIKFTEPWFLGLRMPLTLTGTFEPGVRSKVQQYRIQTWSLSLETFRELRQWFKIYNGLEYKSVNIYGLSPEDATKLRQDKGISIRQKLYTNIIRDRRDHPFIPTTGSMTTGRLEYAGGFLGGDESYYLIETSWSRYQRAWPGWISASRIKWGYVKEFGKSKSAPIDVRYYAGGANSIRGFGENDLGPKSSDGTPEGANVLIVGNQEFRFPLVSKFWGSLFADMGNGFLNWRDIRLNRMAITYGAGLQFISPAGPIRFDYARRIRTKFIGSGYHFHFTILYAF